MYNIFPTVCLVAMLLVGVATGYFIADDTVFRHERAVAADKHVLYLILEACDYDPHPISDVSWEMYRQQLIPLGTATYYTGMVRSANIPSAKCVSEVLPEQWSGG